MFEDFRQNGHAHRPEDAAVERLPADLEAIYDQLVQDSQGWARRLPEAAMLQDYARALGAGTAVVDGSAEEAEPARRYDGIDHSDRQTRPTAVPLSATGQRDNGQKPPHRRAVWASAVSAVVIVALLVGAFALLPRIRGTSGLTTTTATASPPPTGCPPDQITLTLPAHAQLYQIAMTSPTDGWALGRTVSQVDAADVENPLLVQFHQCRWTPVPSPLPGANAALYDISMATAEDGWAAGWEVSGTSESCVLLHYAGGQWQRAALPSMIQGPSSCEQIRMHSPSEGWLLARWGTPQPYPWPEHLLHYLNGEWTVVDSPVSGAFDLATTRTDDVWVAGMRSPADSDPNRMMLVDVAHYVRGQWTTFHLPAGGEGWLTVNSASDGWFVSAALPAQVLRYDGVAWQRSPFTDRAPADGYVTAFDSGDAWTIATTTGTYPKVASMQHFTGGQWQTVQWPFPDDSVLFTPLTRVAPGEYWAVGIRANGSDKSSWKWLLLHYVGGAWHEYSA